MSLKPLCIVVIITDCTNLARPKAEAMLLCRPIDYGDLDQVAELLAKGFPRRSLAQWRGALDVLSRRELPGEYPRFGYMLDKGGAAVGVMLLIFARLPGSHIVRCNGAGWYTVPAFRGYGSLLLRQTLRHKVMRMNVSPSRQALPLIEALGYKRYCDGAMAAVPALNVKHCEATVRRVTEVERPEATIPPSTLQLLRDHEDFGCLSLWCETRHGNYPFIFRRRLVRQLPFVAGAQLIYCPAIVDVVRLAGPVGRYLALQGMPYSILSSNKPIPGLVGRYISGKPLYYHGPDEPALGDLAYTETAMFGL